MNRIIAVITLCGIRGKKILVQTLARVNNAFRVNFVLIPETVLTYSFFCNSLKNRPTLIFYNTNRFT